MSTLKEKCIIVQLTTSHWSAKKYSPKVTQEIDEAHQSQNSGRFNKTLMISKQLEDINTCLGKARSYHYKLTLPWDDAGQRLLPIAEYLDYTAKMEEFKNEHKQLVDEFLYAYPQLRKEAEARLNTLFDEDDYPAVKDLKSKFSIDYKFTVISDASDLRVDVSKEEVKEIKKNIEAGLQEKVNNAKASIVERAKKAVEAVKERLGEENATFRDSLITNITELVETIPVINFDSDANLIELRKKLKKFDIPADSIRKDKELRKETAKKAKKVLKYIKTIKFAGVSIKEEKEVKPQKATRIR